MELIDLKTNTRNKTGKSASRAIRREGIVPAVFYGKKDPVLLSAIYGDLELALKKSRVPQVFINLIVDDGAEGKTAMVKECQIDPLSQQILHVDFYEIAMDQKIKLFVPVVLKGKAKGVEDGGHLQIIRRELEIKSLPADVPPNIEIDVTELGVGDSIHVNDIVPMPGVEIPADVNFTVVTIVATKAATDAQAAAQAGAEGDAAAAGA